MKERRQHTMFASQGKYKLFIVEIILNTGQNHDCVSYSAKVYQHTLHLLKSSSKEHYNIQSYTLSLIVAMR